jgi:hypothetical protein
MTRIRSLISRTSTIPQLPGWVLKENDKYMAIIGVERKCNFVYSYT